MVEAAPSSGEGRTEAGDRPQPKPLGVVPESEEARRELWSVTLDGQDGAALPPVAVAEKTHVAVVTSQGRMLVFPLGEVPELARGKGNKLLNIPTASFKSGEERVVAVAALNEADALVIHAGQRHHRLRFKDLENYLGERARRGRKLPRGFQKVDKVLIE